MITTVTVIYSDGSTEQTQWAGERGEAYAAEMRVWQRIDASHPDRDHRIVSVLTSA